MLALKLRVSAALAAAPGKAFTAEALATELNVPQQTELVYKILEHLAANGGARKTLQTPWFNSTYGL